MLMCECCNKIAVEDDIEYRCDSETGYYLAVCPRCGAIETMQEITESDLIEMYEDVRFELNAIKMRYKRILKGA